jgi:hypothetical protein
VLTAAGAVVPIPRIGRRIRHFGHGDHRHQPVLIPQGAMGFGLPLADLRLSP